MTKHKRFKWEDQPHCYACIYLKDCNCEIAQEKITDITLKNCILAGWKVIRGIPSTSMRKVSKKPPCP